MIEKLLSALFPVRLPRGKILEHVRVHTGDFQTIDGEGIGAPKPKRYRDAIERHWREECENTFEESKTVGGILD